MDSNRQEIEAAVAARFAGLARNPTGELRFPVGRASALALGYPGSEVDSVPAAAVEAFAGVGNPFSLGRPGPGETVIDVGCGAGMDSLLAARWVAHTPDKASAGHRGTAIAPGRVIGVDMVPEALLRARRAAESASVPNVQFRAGHADRLPVPGSIAHLAITNGVLNLCFDKPRVIAEINRVLRPGGRLQMADILLDPDVSSEEAAARGAWSD